MSGVLVLEKRELERIKKEAKDPAKCPVPSSHDIQINIFQDVGRSQNAGRHQQRRKDVRSVELRRDEALAARAALDEISAREWRLHFWSRDGVKQLHSALKLTEVLREREAQSKLQNETQRQTAKYRTAAQEKEREAAKHARELEEQSRAEHAANKALLRDALKSQMKENEERKRAEMLETLRERDELQQLVQQLCDEQQQKKEEVITKQRKFINEFLSIAEQARVGRRADVERENLEQKLNDRTLTEMHEHRDRLEAEKRKVLEDRMARRQKQAEDLYRAYQERLNMEQEQAKQRELELSQRERELFTMWQERERERKRAAMAVREQQRLCAEEQRKAQARRVDLEEREARRRHEEVTRTFKEQQRRELRELQTNNARAYAEQAEQQRAEVVEERVAEHATASRQRLAWDLEDRQFLQYADCMLNEARELGRPEKPLQRTLQNYKKKFSIEQEIFVKASMQSQLDIGLKQKCNGKNTK